MARKTAKIYVAAVVSLLVLDWLFLLFRSFGRGWAAIMKPIFTIVNFPWGFFYFSIEAKTNPWWSATFGRSSWILNDELGPMILLLIIVAVQAAVFTALILGFRKLAAPEEAALCRPNSRRLCYGSRLRPSGSDVRAGRHPSSGRPGGLSARAGPLP